MDDYLRKGVVVVLVMDKISQDEPDIYLNNVPLLSFHTKHHKVPAFELHKLKF